VRGKLKTDPSIQCRSCIGKTPSEQSVARVEVDMGENEKMELVERFCYLGGGEAEDAVRCRIRCAWGKFNQLSPMLTKRGLSLKRKECLYDMYMHGSLVHGSETWPMKVGDVQRMTRTKKMGIVGVEEVMEHSALRWLGHVEGKDDLDYVSKCR
jgi:hypothetical protein